jgi:hypothetical protein
MELPAGDARGAGGIAWVLFVVIPWVVIYPIILIWFLIHTFINWKLLESKNKNLFYFTCFEVLSLAVIFIRLFNNS